MLIVLLDEPGLFVFSSPADAVRQIEPIDAESEIRAPIGIATRIPVCSRQSSQASTVSCQPGPRSPVPSSNSLKPIQSTPIRPRLERTLSHF